MRKTVKLFHCSTLIALSLIGRVAYAEHDSLNASLRSSKENDALQGEVMLETGMNSATSARIGLSFFFSEQTKLHGGFEGGVRASAPWKVSPFVGAGMFLGTWTTHELADNDGVDNDDDNYIDETGEEKEIIDSLLATYPEVGLHLWLAESVRVTASYRYYITSRGRDTDRALYGFGIGFSF